MVLVEVIPRIGTVVNIGCGSDGSSIVCLPFEILCELVSKSNLCDRLSNRVMVYTYSSL